MTTPTTGLGPGVHNIPADAYHADPVDGGSLSSTGARKLLPPSCPALFQHWREHGDEPRKAWDIGHAAHALVLGTGPELVLVDRDRWDTKAVKEELAEIRERGAVPLKRGDWDQVHGMAAALRAHPIAAALLRPDAGRAEQTLVWRDTDTGVMCRARLDWLPAPRQGRLIVPDYKTARSAAPDDLSKALYDHGYYLQAAWYLAGVRALELAAKPSFVFIAQMKERPWLVTVAEADPTAMAIGAHEARMARMTYAECTASGRWPGWTDDVALISLPPWVERRYEMELSR